MATTRAESTGAGGATREAGGGEDWRRRRRIERRAREVRRRTRRDLGTRQRRRLIYRYPLAWEKKREVV